MPRGNIFHGDLAWPFAEDPDDVGRWGVETDDPAILVCGAGARRGGGVSGIPGRNAAMAVLRDRALTGAGTAFSRRAPPGILRTAMAILDALVAGLVTGEVEVVDLTTPLSEDTPVIALPERVRAGVVVPARGHQPLRRRRARLVLAQHPPLRAHRHALRRAGALALGQGSRRRVAGAAGQPRRPGRRHRLLRAGRARTPTSSWSASTSRRGRREHGPLPDGGWLLYRTGWDAKTGDDFLNDGHTPGVAPETARWLAEETPILGIGVETVGTDAGLAATFDPPFPCHWYFLGANKYGLTQLRNLDKLPPQGAVVVASPLPIAGGTGSPARVLALVERG